MKQWLLAALALVAVVACSGSGGGTDNIGGDKILHGTRVHPMPMRNRIIQQPPESPSFMYYGGPLLQHARVVEVLWGPGVTDAALLGRFYASITGSEYFDLLSEYGTTTRPIGPGSFFGLVTHPSPPAGATVDDVAVQTQLAKLIHDGTLPENDADTVYMVHFPPGVTITQGGAASCIDFCAYHGSFQRNDKLVPYVVIPDMDGGCSVGCGTADKLSNTTWVASHELAQVVTNPAIGFATQEPATPLAWFDPMVGEISDACAGSAQIDGYVVQTQWSRKDNKCRFGGSQASTFTIGASPQSQTVKAGTTATILVSTTATAPDPPMVTLEASGLPDGVTATFAPAEVVAGKTAVLSLEAAASAPSAIADVTISGRAGLGSVESTTAKITVDSPRPGNDFSVEATPVTRTVRRGAAVKFAIKTAVVSGDAEPIMLTLDGLPGGVTGAFSPMIVGAGGSSELTISASDSAVVGSALLAIKATARAKTKIINVSLDVEGIPPVNDFAVAIGPGARTVMAGGTTTFQVTTTVTSGQPQNVTLAASGLPPGLTFAFDPPMVVSGNSSTLTLTATGDAGAATGPFTVSASALSGLRSTTATVTILPAPPINDFSINVMPGSRTFEAGQTTSFLVSTTVTSGEAVSVGFAISGLPAGVSAVFEPTSVMAGDSAMLRLTATLAAGAGTSPLTVTGSSTTGTHTASASITITPPPPSDFSISVAPPSQQVTAGGTATYAVTTAVTSGTAEKITLSATGLASGVSAVFTPSMVTAGGTATLKLTTTVEAQTGADSFTVRGTAPSNTHTATASLTVNSLPPPNDFSLSVSPDTRSVLPGDTAVYMVTTAVTSGSAQNVALAVEGLPAGVTGSFNPTSVNAGGTSALTLSASPTAPAAQKTFTVTGTATSGLKLDTAEVVVLPPPITNLIENGGFETGDLTAWEIDVGVATNVSTVAHGGSRAARVGSSTLYVQDSGMYQAIDVPTGKTTTLTFWAYPRCPEVWGSQQAYILDSGGFIIKTIFDDCDDSAIWEKITVSLTAYAGQSVFLYLRTRDYGFAATWMYIDDVEAISQ